MICADCKRGNHTCVDCTCQHPAHGVRTSETRHELVVPPQAKLVKIVITNEERTILVQALRRRMAVAIESDNSPRAIMSQRLLDKLDPDREIGKKTALDAVITVQPKGQ